MPGWNGHSFTRLLEGIAIRPTLVRSRIRREEFPSDSEKYLRLPETFMAKPAWTNFDRQDMATSQRNR
jgi:hypothetical protein